MVQLFIGKRFKIGVLADLAELVFIVVKYFVEVNMYVRTSKAATIREEESAPAYRLR